VMRRRKSSFFMIKFNDFLGGWKVVAPNHAVFEEPGYWLVCRDDVAMSA
jgi:hypothetical protein